MIDNDVVATTVASIAIMVIITFWMKEKWKKDPGKRYPPSAPVLPLIAALCRGRMTILPKLFMNFAQELGPVFLLRVGGRMTVILNGKEAITTAFLRQSEAFGDRAEFWTEANILNPKLRGIVFARYNETFKRHHKLCLAILKEFGFGVNSVSETRILREVESFSEAILKYNGRPFNPKLLTIHSTFSVVSSILFGETFMKSDTCHRISDSVSEYLKSMDLAIDFIPILRFLPRFKRKLCNAEKAHSDLITSIEEGIAYNKSVECDSTFVRRFLEIQGDDYDHHDLVYIVRDICMGSADTVSTMLQWSMVELANHPVIQSRLQNEIDEVVGKNKILSLDDKPRLPYTEAVILEVFRRHTIVPLYIPHATFKEAEVLGYNIPRGCMVLANSFCAHMDPQIWNDPENFRPERFLDVDHSIVGSERVIAFGMGKRSCLGEILGRQESFLFFAGLVQRFDIRPPEGQDSIKVKPIIGGVVHPSRFEVRLIPRTTTVS